MSDVPPDSFSVLDAESTAGIGPDCTGRFLFRVPDRWISPVRKNPFAAEAERRVLSWFQALGCSQAELARAASSTPRATSASRSPRSLPRAR